LRTEAQAREHAIVAAFFGPTVCVTPLGESGVRFVDTLNRASSHQNPISAIFAGDVNLGKLQLISSDGPKDACNILGDHRHIESSERKAEPSAWLFNLALPRQQVGIFYWASAKQPPKRPLVPQVISGRVEKPLIRQPRIKGEAVHVRGV
jgi:hypothetical protein